MEWYGVGGETAGKKMQGQISDSNIIDFIP